MANATWRFSDSAKKAMQDASAIAQKYHHRLVDPVHLALALLGPLPGNSPFDSLPRSLFLKVIARAHGDLQLFQSALTQTIARLPSHNLPPKHISRSLRLERVLNAVISARTTQKDTLVGIDHLISGILRDGDVQAALQVAHIPKSKINSIHIAIKSESRISKLSKSNAGVVAFVTDTSLAAKRMVDPVIGRDEEIRRLIIVLSRRKNNNAILVGESGIGKTSIVSFNFLFAFGFETHSQNLGGKSHDSIYVFKQL
jgi:ATP-dependent Clp protease ATP-binding subunit ClpB